MPLALHLLDVAASANAILDREPLATRERMGAILGLSWPMARPWLLLLIAAHDIGKACPAFQLKWEGAKTLMGAAGLRVPPAVDTRVNHAWVSQAILAEMLEDHGWLPELASMAADAVGCHHGIRCSPTILDRLGGDRTSLGGSDWKEARRDLFEALLHAFQPGMPPVREEMSGPDFMLLSGLTSFADWIGSNEHAFPFGTPEDCQDLQAWWAGRQAAAAEALDQIGWLDRTPLVEEAKSFEGLFGFPPRPLQTAMARALDEATGPSLLLVEAPMGEGKTEAAFLAHLEMQRRFGHRGLYVALPTQATGNAMFTRTLAFLHSQAPGRALDLQLVHGGAPLSEAFQELRLAAIHDAESGGAVRAAEWFTQRKRALLSEYGVGTVDQALLAILPVRHQFVRLWGLANRVVIFDEVHAYDTYTGTLLVGLVRWLLALGSSVVLLSATLPPGIRRKLAAAAGVPELGDEPTYPRLSLFQSGQVCQTGFPPDPSRRLFITLSGIPAELEGFKAALALELAPQGGLGLALVNTVARAQELYTLFGAGEPLRKDGHPLGKRLADGTEVFLFHARFPADLRHLRETLVLETFGARRAEGGRKVLIATQVAEQSLDLDFDVIASDLAPIDLLLQRAGRLWRHERPRRPLPEPRLLVAGLEGTEPPDFGRPLWWGAIYREDILLRTWALLQGRAALSLPDEIDLLVQAVYEEEVPLPSSIQGRHQEAQEASEGEAYAQGGLALQALIGWPEDGSWNEPARFIKADEDEAGLHPTLVAQTRLGEPSVQVVPVTAGEGFDPEAIPSQVQAQAWARRTISLSARRVVLPCLKAGVPPGWSQSPLLRRTHPLLLNQEGRWVADPGVRLVDELGLVYEPKEGM